MIDPGSFRMDPMPENWQPTAYLRWLMCSPGRFAGDVLEQMWIDTTTGREEWRPLSRVFYTPPHPARTEDNSTNVRNKVPSQQGETSG